MVYVRGSLRGNCRTDVTKVQQEGHVQLVDLDKELKFASD